MKGHFEIVSLSGLLSLHGGHLHISVSDGKGVASGGHLVEGSKVYTTLELVLGIYQKYKFKRTLDLKTSFNELEVQVVN